MLDTNEFVKNIQFLKSSVSKPAKYKNEINYSAISKKSLFFIARNGTGKNSSAMQYDIFGRKVQALSKASGAIIKAQ